VHIREIRGFNCRFWVELFRLRLTHSMAIRFACIVAALAVRGLAGCSKNESAPRATSAASTQILRLSQRNEPADLDPAVATLPDEFFIIRALSEGLVTPSPAGGQQPAAADRWEISPDHLVYTFHLRPDGRWSNGDPVTASDFVESYHRLLTPATAASKGALFYGVKNARAFLEGKLNDFSAVGFRALDDQTLAVTLEAPASAFLAYVASGPWIPVNPRVVAKFGRNWTRPENFVGNGPFTLTEWRPNQRIVVRKNPRYADAARVKLAEIQFIAFDTGDAEDLGYRAGQVDVTMAVPLTKIDVYAKERPNEFHRTPLAETRYLAFNTRRPPLDNPQVRQALSLTIDRARITDRVTHSGIAAADFLAPALMAGAAAAAPPEVTTPRADPGKARELLAAAGYPNGRGFPRLEMSCWSTSQLSTLEAIQEMWKTELGVEVSLTKSEAKVHQAALREGNYDIGFMTAIPDAADPLLILSYLTGASPDNYSHWVDPAFDDLITKARHAPDPATGRALMSEAEARIAAFAPIAPLYYNTQNWLQSPRVHGWHADALWTRFYKDISLEEK